MTAAEAAKISNKRFLERSGELANIKAQISQACDRAERMIYVRGLSTEAEAWLLDNGYRVRLNSLASNHAVQW